MNLTISPKLIRKFLLILITCLAIAHIGQLIVYFVIDDDEVFDFIELFDFDYEANLPSFYSALAILFCSALLMLITKHKGMIQDKFYKHWYMLAAIFLFLSLDEATALHEELGDFVESLALFEASGMLYFAWVVPYALLLILFLGSYLKFLIHLEAFYRWRFIACGTLFVLGAVGIETISASEADSNGTETIKYSVLYTIEELCEMTSIAFFAHTLLLYIEAHTSELNIKIAN